MQRKQLFELEDQRWFPGAIREAMTDYLRVAAEQTDIFRPVVPVIERALQRSGGLRMVDLGSGSGGGILLLFNLLKKDHPGLTLTLTDLYPNREALERVARQSGGRVSYDPRSVDARHVPDDLPGLRTLLLSFHHFERESAERILRAATEADEAILVLETFERRVTDLLLLLLTPLATLLLTPRIRPRRLTRLLLTYAVPLVPACVLWDGLVSVARCYRREEMRAMVQQLERPGYRWEIGRVPDRPFGMIYLLGYPSP